MLRKLVTLSLSYRLVVLGLALAVAVLGTWAFLGLPVDAYPNIAQTQVKMILKAIKTGELEQGQKEALEKLKADKAAKKAAKDSAADAGTKSTKSKGKKVKPEPEPEDDDEDDEVDFELDDDD